MQSGAQLVLREDSATGSAGTLTVTPRCEARAPYCRTRKKAVGFVIDTEYGLVANETS